MAIKEFIPIVIAAEVWGQSWSRKRILFKLDNSAVVAALKSGLCQDHHLAYCLRELAIRAVLFSFTYSGCHIPGSKNLASDALSRLRLQDFKSLVPNANPNSTYVPQDLLLKLLFPPWTKHGAVYL